MNEQSTHAVDVEALLRDYFDFGKYFATDSDELSEDQLDLISAAGGYAVFLNRVIMGGRQTKGADKE